MFCRRAVIMYKIAVFVVICVAVCYGQTTRKPVYCSDTPANILKCLNSPHVLSPDVTSKCHDPQATECQVMTCAFREYNWFKNNKADKAKVTAHFNQLAKDKPEWKTVIDYVIPSCVERELPAQGVYLNCPAYDIMQCVLTSFIQRSQASQWASSPECLPSREYAGACPVCPSECFAPAIPYGSCNACYGRPVPAVPAA